MISSNLFTILVFSITSALLGVFLLRIAIRGKLLSPNPHCRKCRFDLQGLDHTKPTPCPECGTTLRSNTPAITQGLRKTRKIVLLASILFILTAATGFAWPKLSNLQSIQNINIYNHFPEPLLTKLATTGDTKALQTLHDRLIPGEVSDKALQTLIDHAFILQADESATWDKRWGDVLMYAMLEDRLPTDQLDLFLRASKEIVIAAHEQVGPQEEIVHFRVGTRTTGAFENDSGFIHKWKNQSSGFADSGRKLALRLHTFQHSVARNDNPVIQNPRGGIGSESGFYLHKGSSGSWVLKEEFSTSESELKITFIVDFELFAGEELVHQWEEELTHVFERIDTPIQRMSPAQNQDEINDFVHSIHVDRVSVPIKLGEASKHKRTQFFGYGAMNLSAKNEHQISLIGSVYFKLGEFTTPPLESVFAFVPDQYHSKTNQYMIGFGQNGIQFMKNNKLFWIQAVLKGSVDVVIVPDIDAYTTRPDVTKYLDTPIIFRDVPIERYEPVYGSVQDQDGNRWEEWRWGQVGDWIQYNPTTAELYKEE